MLRVRGMGLGTASDLAFSTAVLGLERLDLSKEVADQLRGGILVDLGVVDDAARLMGIAEGCFSLGEALTRANRRVLKLSSWFSSAGLMVASMAVLALPPRLSLRILARSEAG